MQDNAPIQQNASLELRFPGDAEIQIVPLGDWNSRPGLLDLGPLQKAVQERGSIGRMRWDTTRLGSWDSLFISFLVQCRQFCEGHHIEFDATGLPEGARRLVDLASAAPSKDAERKETPGGGWLAAVGRGALRLLDAVRGNVAFLGNCALSMMAVAKGRVSFRKKDALLLFQHCGPEAVPIVALISFLVGLIMAYVGSVQLEQFGAGIFVADLVALAMVREMGCMMTAIIMCGRTGAAFAAQIGTMKVNQEIDALTTFGIAPVDFLVAPRLLALVLMLPLLTLISNLVGILGGFVVALGMLDLSVMEYWHETLKALNLTQVSTGIVKSFFFGAIIAYTACLRGVQCGGNAMAVGQAATSAAVTGITWVIVADAIFAALFNVLDI